MAIEDRFGQMAWKAIQSLGRGANDAPKAPQLAQAVGALAVDRMHLSDAQLLPSGLRQVKNMLRAGDSDRAQDLVGQLLARGGMFENRMLAAEPPRVSDVLDLVRHAHDFGMASQVKDGLNWGVELLRENPAREYVAEAKAGRGKGMIEGVVASSDGTVQDKASLYLSASKEANAIASLALATENEPIARKALSMVRPHLQPDSAEITKRLKLLSQSLDETQKPKLERNATGEARRQSARRPLEFGVERERTRLEGVRLSARQPLPERQALLQQIQRGEVPVLEGIQRLKERNPQHEEALSFMQACLKASPEQRKNVNLDFVLEDNVPTRTDAASRLVDIFSAAGSPKSAEVTALFLEMHPEFRGLETVREHMLKKLKALRAADPETDFYARQLESPTALLDWADRYPGHRGSIREVIIHEQADDGNHRVRFERGRLRFDYAEFLNNGAQSVRLLERNDRVKPKLQGINELLSDAENHIRTTLRIRPDARFSWGGWTDSGAGKTVADESQARVAAALGVVNESEAVVSRSLADLRAEIPNLLASGKAEEAKSLLQTAQHLPEAFWAEQTWDGVMPLLRIADAQGWHTERKELFAQAARLAKTPAEQQEMIWLGRLMGESAENLPSRVEPAVGRRVLTEFLASTRNSEQDYPRVLKALEIQNESEAEFWTQWRKALTLPGDQEPGYVIEQLLDYTQQKTQKGRYGAMLDVLNREEKWSQALKSGFDVLKDGAPPAHQGLVEAGRMAPFNTQRQILARLQRGVPESADAVSELLWLANAQLEVNQVPREAAAALVNRLPAERQALAQFLVDPSIKEPGRLQRLAVDRLKQPLANEATGLSELRWLANEVGEDRADVGSAQAAVSLLGLMRPHLQGNEKLLADTVKDFEAADVHRQVLRSLLEPGDASKNPLDALVALNIDADTRSALLGKLPSLADSPDVSPLQRVLAKNAKRAYGGERRGTEEAANQLFAALKSASAFRGDVREGVLDVLDKTVREYASSYDSITNANRRVERVAWAALADQVQSPEKRVIQSVTREGGVSGEKVRMELFKAIKTRRFERASELEALLAFVKSVPEGEGKRNLRVGVLEELQAYYEELGDKRALALVKAAMAHDENVASNSDFENFNNVADSVFKQLEQQL